MKSTRPDFRSAAKQKLSEDRGALSAAVEGLLSIDTARIAVRTVKLPEIHLRPERAAAETDDDAVVALAESIRRVGILEPILVRPRPAGGYEVMAGEQRWRAARALELRAIPVVIREIDDATAAQLVEARGRSSPATDRSVVAAPLAAVVAAGPIERVSDEAPDIGVPVMAERLRTEPRVTSSSVSHDPAPGYSAGQTYGIPAAARSAAPRREPRVISGPGMAPTNLLPLSANGDVAPERIPMTVDAMTPPAPAEPQPPLARIAEPNPKDVQRRRVGFWPLPRLRPIARRDRA